MQQQEAATDMPQQQEQQQQQAASDMPQQQEQQQQQTQDQQQQEGSREVPQQQEQQALATEDQRAGKGLAAAGLTVEQAADKTQEHAMAAMMVGGPPQWGGRFDNRYLSIKSLLVGIAASSLRLDLTSRILQGGNHLMMSSAQT